MYIDRVLIKRNAKNTFFHGYWSCVLTGLVLALATGALNSGASADSYTFTNTSDSGRGIFGGEFYSYDPMDMFGGAFNSLNIPTYMIGTFITVMTIVCVVSFLIAIFLLQPLEVGCRKFFIGAGKEDYDLSHMGSSFSSSYSNVVKIMFLRSLFTFLWTLLFIIPGIIKFYEYRMIPYILAEDPSISSHDAFMKSRRMMSGSKFGAFVFDLSFIGWFFIDSISFGIAGIFFVKPYYYSACAGLYLFLKVKADSEVSYANGTYYMNGPAQGGYQNTGYQNNGYQNTGYQNGGYQNTGYQNGGYQNTGYQAPSYQPPAPADSPDTTGTSQPDSTVSADDARPFRTPYGQ